MKNLAFKEVLPISGQPAEQLVMFFHGVGSNGADLIELSPLFAKDFPNTHFISADGPEPYDLAPGADAYQWFSLSNRDDAVLYQELQRNTPLINQFIDQQLARLKLDDSKLVLIGFSQGTMTVLHVSLRRERGCVGVIGFSGCLVGSKKLLTDIKSKPQILLIHGREDEVVPVVLTTQASRVLTDLSCPVDTKIIPGLTHSIDRAGINMAIDFLSKIIKGQ